MKLEDVSKDLISKLENVKSKESELARIIELTDAADKSLEKEKFELSQLRETKSNLQNKVEELNSTAAVIEKQNIQVNADLEAAIKKPPILIVHSMKKNLI